MPFFLSADEQTLGRGRSGREWISPKGNFYGTFALDARKSDLEMAQVSLVAAVSVAKVFSSMGLRPQLKWPNDVLISNAKISGILLEKNGSALLVGIGINISNHPTSASYLTTSLKALGVNTTPNDLGSSLEKIFLRYLKIWDRDGFEPINQAWSELAHKLNDEIHVRIAGRPDQSGYFRGLSSDGGLKLEVEQEIVVIHAGEVFF